MFETTGTLDYMAENAYGPYEGSQNAENIAGAMDSFTILPFVLAVVGILALILGGISFAHSVPEGGAG